MKREQVSAAQGGFFVTIATAAGSTTKKVDGDLLTVGRADDCHLTISHETLSRRHLTITMKDGTCWIEDHASSNGTFVNGKRLQPHSLTRVVPEDQVTMGQAGVRLSVSADQPVDRSIKMTSEQTGTHPVNTIVTSTQTVRRTARMTMPDAKPREKEEARDQIERLLQDSQKKAATMIQEAELEAERRVEDIYRRAHETQSKMDEVYQKRMNEAYRSAEQIYQKSQEESQKILDGGRLRSTEIRQQAESFVMELRRRTEEDCERMLDEAQQTARDLKEQRMLEAEDIIKKKEEELVTRTRAAMNDRVARMEQELAEQGLRARSELDNELMTKRLQFETDHRDQIEAIIKLKTEVKLLQDNQAHEKSLMNEVELAKKRQAQEALELKEQADVKRNAILELNQELSAIRGAIAQFTAERVNYEGKVKEGKDTIAKLTEEAKNAKRGLAISHDDYNNQLLQMRAKFEEDKAKFLKQEQVHFEELKLQTSRKVQGLERQLVDELHAKKERLTRELALVVEAHLKDKDGSTRGLQELMSVHFQKQIATIANDDAAKGKQATLVSMKRQQRFKSTVLGLAFGAAAMFGGERVLWHVRSDMSPIQRKVVTAQEERKADLELRKFNPPMTRDFKSTYVDNVVYTENFIQVYTSDDFQSKLMRALTPYMIKTWKVDEDQTIQLIGMTSALVKSLAEKKANIHPDFVAQALEKMKDSENEGINRMRALLGSQVRLESFRKFEKSFFEKYDTSAIDGAPRAPSGNGPASN